MVLKQFCKTRTKRGVEMYKGKHLDTLLPQTVTHIDVEASESVSDIPVKLKSTAKLVWNTKELKVPVLCPSFALTVT